MSSCGGQEKSLGYSLSTFPTNCIFTFLLPTVVARVCLHVVYYYFLVTLLFSFMALPLLSSSLVNVDHSSDDWRTCT